MEYNTDVQNSAYVIYGSGFLLIALYNTTISSKVS